MSAAAGQLDTAGNHSCVVLAGAGVRCWGFGGDGRLGYANTRTVGDDETPGSIGPVHLGGPAATIAAGDGHTCALLTAGSVRCWGFSGDGQVGYPVPGGNPPNIGDDESPGSVGPVDLGLNRTATAITAGGFHSCAVLDDATLRCWGYGGNGQLGYPDPAPRPGWVADPPSIGDDETPGSAGPVDIGAGRTATAVTAGELHTCALLNLGAVRCWGVGLAGQLGYGNLEQIGDNETPGSVGPVKLGAGRTAVAIAAGKRHTCALLNLGDVRCWGQGFYGQLGYGDQASIGDGETPDSVGPVNLGAGRRATAITAGGFHTCAVLDNGTVRCWGYGGDGQLGYGNTSSIGDNETPGSVGPVDLGPGRTAVAISAGERHTCARLDDASVRCWGYGGSGRLGYCNELGVGDDEPPGSVAPVDLEMPGTACPGSGPGPLPGPPGADGAQSGAGAAPAAATVPQPSVGPGPGRVTGLRARPVSRTEIKLWFLAPASDGPDSPPAGAYLVKQSRRPIRGARRFRRSKGVCKGSCRFSPRAVGAKITLTVTNLHPRTTYYFAIAARDLASKALGPRSRTVKAKTR